MCQFFSLISDGNGNAYYFNWEQRKKILVKEIATESADSHTSIATFYGFKGEAEDKMNKYEYNPLTGVFTVDQLNTTNDKCLIEKLCRGLDFKTIIEPIVIKPIENPLEKGTTRVTEKDKKLLKRWDSVRASVRASVGAYQGSLFNIWGTEYKFQPAVDLWKRGFVASFDGTTWRLHSGKKAEIVWEGKL